MDAQERKALDARSSVKGFDGSPLDRGRRNLHGREVVGHGQRPQRYYEKHRPPAGATRAGVNGDGVPDSSRHLFLSGHGWKRTTDSRKSGRGRQPASGRAFSANAADRRAAGRGDSPTQKRPITPAEHPPLNT